MDLFSERVWRFVSPEEVRCRIYDESQFFLHKMRCNIPKRLTIGLILLVISLYLRPPWPKLPWNNSNLNYSCIGYGYKIKAFNMNNVPDPINIFCVNLDCAIFKIIQIGWNFLTAN